jgi:hypothetical protein
MPHAPHGEEAVPNRHITSHLAQTQTSRAVECGALAEGLWHVCTCGVWCVRWPARDMNLVPDQEVPAAAAADVGRTVVSLTSLNIIRLLGRFLSCGKLTKEVNSTLNSGNAYYHLV